MNDLVASLFQSLDAVNTAVSHGNFPPRNIYRMGDNLIVMEFAVAGFSRDELQVEVAGNVLQITGKKNRSAGPDLMSVRYIHRGIAARNFGMRYELPEYWVVAKVELSNGMLTLRVEQHIPESAKPRTLVIGDAAHEDARSPAAVVAPRSA